MSENWFSKGLNFECTRCGACCSGKPGFVWVDDGEIEELARVLHLPVVEIRDMHTFATHRGRSLRERENGDCIYYVHGVGCTVYEARPRQCRSWPFWDSNLTSPKEWDATVAACPGAGTGSLITEDEILARVRMIRL